MGDNSEIKKIGSYWKLFYSNVIEKKILTHILIMNDEVQIFLV